MADEFPDSELIGRIADRAVANVRKGLSFERAVLETGVSSGSFRTWRQYARRGGEPYRSFFERLERAQAEGELADVDVVTDATKVDGDVCCPSCSATIDIRSFIDAHKMQVAAAGVALDRLARRNPRDWAPSSRVSIEAEHESFLDLAEEVLEPAQFARLLEAYRERMGAVVPVGKPEPETPPVH